MKAADIVVLVLSAAAAAAGFFSARALKTKLKKGGESHKKLKKRKMLFNVLSIFGLWLFVIKLLGILFKSNGGSREFSVEISAEKMNLFGLEISSTIVFTWIVMAVLIFVSLLVRILVIPKMKKEPSGIQNVLEIMVEGISKYTGSKAEGLGDSLGAYIFTVAVFLVACAATELFGVRAPTADITMTLALALITFVLINYYGIKKKGVKGRIKGLAKPNAFVFAMRIVSDCAIPVSMACRLFGNMLGGMIVMDLLYYALGNSAIGIPSVAGLYFNVFHPLIQAFIFVTLTLTFINEATETEEA